MNHKRLQVVAGAKAVHLVALGLSEFIWSPLAGTGREDLKCITPEPVSPFGRVLDSPGGRGMYTNAPGSQAWRSFRTGPLESVLFLRHRARHSKSIDGGTPILRSPNLRCRPGNDTLTSAASPATAGAKGRSVTGAGLSLQKSSFQVNLC